MTTLTASVARATLYRLLDQAASSHEPIPGMRESIRKGLKMPQPDPK